MKTPRFTKREASQDFDHQLEVKEIFAGLGFDDVKINTSFANGVSHYIRVDLKVLDPMKIYYEMFCFEGTSFAEIRISDHSSNLDTVCGGVSGNKMNLASFKYLIENGIVENNN